jgi:hypothetical protein
MAKNDSGQQSAPPRSTWGQYAKRAALFVLFSIILVIPRIRRLRRRVWAWTCVRLGLAGCGGLLLWRYTHAKGGASALAAGVLLLAFSLLIHARPVVKSVDAMANELGALIVLNGGVFRQSPESTPIRDTQLFVHPERVIVQDSRQHRVLEIPLTKLRTLATQPVANGSGKGAQLWEVELNWLADGPRTTTFRYDGVFAEHLAQVTESTLRSQWKKGLAVIQP